MTDKACAVCAKRFVTESGRLECRARPPAADVVYGRFPVVRGEDFCHSDFALDAQAAAARAAAQAETRRLEDLVAQTSTVDAAAPAPEDARPSRARRARGAGEPGPLL